MTTLVLGEHPDVEALLAHRRSLGLDLRDEVWDGVYVMAPFAHRRHGRVKSDLVYAVEGRARQVGLRGGDSFNLGREDDYRVPDAGWHREAADGVFVPSAALVLEVLSPGDQTYAKLDFYAAHGVEELLVADPEERTVRCWHLADGGYLEHPGSALLGLTMDALVDQVRWPEEPT